MKNRPHYVYELLAGLFVTTLLVSNIASVKLIGAGPLVFDAGTVLFPLAYIIGDIITEVYGFRKMRFLIYVGIISLLLMTLTFWVVGMLPSTPEWTNQASYNAILGVVWRIVFASIIAIFVGEILNSYVLAKLKIHTKGKRMWERVVGSSAIGGLVDTVVFSTIAFAGTISAGPLLSLIITVYLIKLATEIIVSPVTLAIIRKIKKSEKIDIYEEPTFNLRG